ncbi:MAG: response regulator [Treponema sp.]|nr:response regulator [Treponema sp.]
MEWSETKQREEKRREENNESLIDRLTRKKILVIDDDPLVLKTVRDILGESYEVAVSRSGAVAYRYLESTHVDLILLDYEMPGEKGTSVMQNIHKIPFAHGTPVVFLTGAADSKTVAEILVLKPKGYLLKPVSKNKLLAKVEEVLNEKPKQDYWEDVLNGLPQ